MGLVTRSFGLWREASREAGLVGRVASPSLQVKAQFQVLSEHARLRRAVRLERNGNKKVAAQLFEELREASDPRIRNVAWRHAEVLAGRGSLVDQIEALGRDLPARMTDPRTLLPLALSGIVARGSQLLSMQQLKSSRFLARELGTVASRAWVGTVGFSAEILTLHGLQRALGSQESVWGREHGLNPFWGIALGLGGMRLGSGIGKVLLNTRRWSPGSRRVRWVQEGAGFAGALLGSGAQVWASGGPAPELSHLLLQSALMQFEFGVMGSVLSSSLPALSRLQIHGDRQLESLGTGRWIQRWRDWQGKLRQNSPVKALVWEGGYAGPSLTPQSVEQVFQPRLYSQAQPPTSGGGRPTPFGHSSAGEGVPQPRGGHGSTEPHQQGSSSYSGVLPVRFIEGKVLGREEILLLPETTPGLRGSYPLVEVRPGLRERTLDCTFVGFSRESPMPIALARSEHLSGPARFYLVPRQPLSNHTNLEQAGSLMSYQQGAQGLVHALYLGRDQVTLGRHSGRGLEHDTSISRRQALLVPWGGGDFILTNLSKASRIKVRPKEGTEYVVPSGGQAVVRHGDRLILGRNQEIGLVDLLSATTKK